MILNREDYYSRKKHYAQLLRSQTSGGGGTHFNMWADGFPIITTADIRTVDGKLNTQAQTSFPSLLSSTSGLFLTKADMGSATSILFYSSTLLDFIVGYGTYAFNVNYTTVNPPTIPTARLPNGSFIGTQLWLWVSNTSFTGVPTLIYSYINQDGVLKNMTYNIGYAPPISAAIVLPLADNDSGIQQLISIQSTVATAGLFTLFIGRQITTFTNESRNKSNQVFNFLNIGLPWLSDQSALTFAVKSGAATYTTMANMEFVAA